MKFCSQCGDNLILKIPEDDDRNRFVCSTCEHIHYQNPRIIVCTLPYHDDRVMLCKRAIEPRYGKWTLPGGFMENDETTHEGALRETWEEARARVNIDHLYSYYSLPHINQVHFFFRSKLLDLNYKAGKESLEVEMFRETEIPWEEIAFLAVKATLQHYFRDLKKNSFPVHSGDIIVDHESDYLLIKDH